MVQDRVSVPRQYVGFLLISGTGLVLATVILWAGVRLAGRSPFVANFVGDAVAITFVFFVSARRTFVHAHRFLLARFGAYVGWQIVHVSLISWGVASMVDFPLFREIVARFAPTEVVAKLLLTPVTVTANFIVARFLIERIQP